MDDLTAWLLARIAEDEEAAQAASPGGWSYSDVASVGGGTLYDESRRIADLHYEQPGDHDGSIVRHLLETEADATGRHIARHDPARVLAECATKRDLIEWALGIEALRTMGDPAAPERPVGQECLRILASGYADRPGYRDEWRD